MYERVIANGVVVTATADYPADVGITGERIAAVGLGLQGEQVLDAAGCYVIPGGVDVHVHLQMTVGGYTSSDSFESGTAAAACGGTTTVVDFVEPKGDQPMIEALAARRAEADPQVGIDYGLHMTIPAWHADHALSEIPAVMAAGVYSFKMYQAYGPLCLDDVRLYAALQALGRQGGLPILHSENGPVIDRLRAEALAAGRTAPIWHARTRPASLEGEAVGRALELAHQAEAPLYIVHVSCAESLEQIVQARQRGWTVYGETCPQYLFLTAEKLAGEHSERFVCAPPLRGTADQESLWGALARGDLQVVSTDHCPFTATEKAAEADFARVPGGLPSIEARLSLVHEAVQGGRLDLNRWVATCCTAPARLFRLPYKGHIAPGYDADVVIFDPAQQVELAAGWLHERVDWSPYEGMALTGWPREVFSRGALIVREGEYLGEPGRGRFIRAG
jgi:dihydropyrimidinase